MQTCTVKLTWVGNNLHRLLPLVCLRTRLEAEEVPRITGLGSLIVAENLPSHEALQLYHQLFRLGGEASIEPSSGDFSN